MEFHNAKSQASSPLIISLGLLMTTCPPFEVLIAARSIFDPPPVPGGFHEGQHVMARRDLYLEGTSEVYLCRCVGDLPEVTISWQPLWTRLSS